MPLITVEGPKIADVAVKRSLVRELTSVTAKAYGLPPEVIIVLIKENAPENVGVAGQLICDRKKT